MYRYGQYSFLLACGCAVILYYLFLPVRRCYAKYEAVYCYNSHHVCLRNDNGRHGIHRIHYVGRQLRAIDVLIDSDVLHKQRLMLHGEPHKLGG